MSVAVTLSYLRRGLLVTIDAVQDSVQLTWLHSDFKLRFLDGGLNLSSVLLTLSRLEGSGRDL